MKDKLSQADFSLLRPFDLEKAKQGDKIYLLGGGCGSLIAGPNSYGEVCLNIEQDGFFVTKGIDHIRMAPLCWVEGKPVYKGDILWNTVKGLEDFYYKVKGYSNYSSNVYSEEGCTGRVERLCNLSWSKQTVLPEVIHDPNAFSEGDTVKIVKTLPVEDYGNKGWYNAWVEEMDSYRGETFVVKSEHNKYGFSFDIYEFPSCTLELVEKAKPKKVKVVEVYIDGKLVSREEITIE